MKYKLLKDLPWANAGDILDETETVFPAKSFPNFFEPIPETPKKPKTVWDLKEWDKYYFLTVGWVREFTFRGWEQDEDAELRRMWEIFLTKEEAERELAYRKAKIAILKHHAENSGFKPCWTDGLEKFSIYYVHPHGTVEKWLLWICPSEWHQEQVLCYFASREEARQSIKDCEKEWLVIFNVK